MKYFFLVLVALLFSHLFFTPPVLAATDLRGQIQNNISKGADSAGLGNAKPQEVAARFIQIILSVVGILFTSLMVISGYNIFTAAGDEGKVEKAKKTIKASIIGLAITLGAYSITTFIGTNANKVTNEPYQQQRKDTLEMGEILDVMGGGDE